VERRSVDVMRLVGGSRGSKVLTTGARLAGLLPVTLHCHTKDHHRPPQTTKAIHCNTATKCPCRPLQEASCELFDISRLLLHLAFPARSIET
jgi:hypothetical protein